MSTPAQPSVPSRTTVTSGADSLSTQLVSEDDLHRFERELRNGRDDDQVPHQPLANHYMQLEVDLMRFRNGEIDASEFEASLVRFKQALQDARVSSGGYLKDGQFMLTEYPISFSELPEGAQKAYAQGFLDRYDPIQIYGKRLETVLADFRAERASGQDLERALIEFEENLTAAGVGTMENVRDGEYLVHDTMVALENAMGSVENLAHDFANSFLNGFGVDTGHVAETANTPFTPFSWLQREQQMNVADRVLNDYLYNSPEAQRQEKYELAASIVLPDSPEAANQIAEQSARVAELRDSLLPFLSSDSSTPVNTELLVREVTELVRLWEEQGVRFTRLYYDAGTNTVRRTYNSDNPPPWMTQNQIYNLNEEYKNSWSRSRAISALEVNDLLQIAHGVANSLLAKVRGLTLDHVDQFGDIKASTRMRQLLDELNAAQNVPDNVDLDAYYTANIATAQLHLGSGDLKHYEYRLTDAARAVLGDDGWGLHRDTLFSAYHWITRQVALPRQETMGNSDNDLIPRPPEDVPFTNAWNGSSRETRIEYLGFDVETWNEVEPLLAEAVMAHKQRKDGELTVNDAVGLGMAAFIGYASGGALAPAVTSFLGGSALAGVAGAAVGGAVGSMFSTLIITGDWVTARESFKDIFEGDLKEGLAELALKYIGVDTRYAALVNSATSDEAIDQLTEELGLELVQQFGGPVIDGLKSYTPDIVDSYLDDLKKVLLTVDDPELIAEHAIGWWGGELASMLGVANENGIKLVTSLLDTAVTSGDFDIGALQEFLGQEVVDYLADVPAEVVERLGGKDSTLALLGGVAAQLVVNNLDNAIEGESFSDNLIEDARVEFEEFVTGLAENWVEQGGLEAVLTWIPGSENWGADFSDMIMAGHASGWDGDTLRAHLSESSLFSNLVNSYVPGGGLQNFLTRAIQYASENGLDTQTILNAATIDMVDILANAGISQDVVNFLGGNSAMLAKMSDVFGQRLIENGGDLNATLRDMEKYARGLAAGHIGDFTQSILTQVLGPKAGQVIDAMAGLAEGEAAGWSDEAKEKYIDEQILTPLGDSAAAVVIGAFGGKQNFVAGLLGAMADAYVTNEGDSTAARGAAIDFIMNRLTGLVGGNDLQAEGGLTLVGPQPFSLAESVSQLIQFADENDWDEKAITGYVEDQFLNNGLAGNLIDTLLGGFGTRAQLSAVLVEELISSWNETGDPEKVIERFVTFILNPPEVTGADPLSNDKITGAASSLDSVIQGSSFGIESGTMDAATASGLETLVSSAEHCLAESVPIPGMPLVSLAAGKLGFESHGETMQAAIDYLDCKARAGIDFTDEEKVFLHELYEAFWWGGTFGGMNEAGELADYYVNGDDPILEIESEVYEASVVVQDTTVAMQSHIRDLAANGESFAKLSTADLSFRQSSHFSDVMLINGSRDIGTQGYVQSNGLVFAEQDNSRLKNTDNRFYIQSVTEQTADGEFITTFRVENKYDFVPYSGSTEEDERNITSLRLSPEITIELPDGLSEYMASNLGIANVFDYYAEWTIRWS